MCLIVFTPNIRRATIRKSVLERGFDKNRDGAGFAYLANGRVVVSKGYDAFPAFWRAYRAIVAVARGPVLIHFRWSTIGSENLTNTQPSVIQPDVLVMAHNGTFSGLKDVANKVDISDSLALARLLGRLGWAFPYSRPQVDMLRALCDDSSKLVFLSSTGRHLIINESEGKWSRGAWYSDGGDVLETVKPHASVYSPTGRPYIGTFSPPDDDAALYGNEDYDDFTVGSTKVGRRIRQKPSMGGVRRTALTIGIHQQMDIFAKQHGAKSFEALDPDMLAQTSDWLTYRKLLGQAAEIAALTS